MLATFCCYDKAPQLKAIMEYESIMAYSSRRVHDVLGVMEAWS